MTLDLPMFLYLAINVFAVSYVGANIAWFIELPLDPSEKTRGQEDDKDHEDDDYKHSFYGHDHIVPPKKGERA